MTDSGEEKGWYAHISYIGMYNGVSSAHVKGLV